MPLPDEAQCIFWQRTMWRAHYRLPVLSHHYRDTCKLCVQSVSHVTLKINVYAYKTYFSKAKNAAGSTSGTRISPFSSANPPKNIAKKTELPVAKTYLCAGIFWILSDNV